jgi:cell division septum initiation protein DivIVA
MVIALRYADRNIMTLTIDVLAPGAGIDWFLKYVLELERLPNAEAITLESAEPGRARLRVDTDAEQRFLAEIFNVETFPADRMRMLTEGEFELVVNPTTLRVLEPGGEEITEAGAKDQMNEADFAEGPSVADRILTNAATSARLRSVISDVDTAVDRPAAWSRSEAYERAREVINEAYETAAEIRLEALSRVREQITDAERQASDTISRARDDAERIIAQATAEAELALQRAHRDSDGMLTQARQDADRVTQRAKEEADEITDAARREAQEVLNSVSAALKQVTERQTEIERMEAEFHSVATQFMKWLGSSGRPQERMFRNVLAKFSHPDEQK